MKRKTMQTEEQSGAGLLARLDTEPDRAMEALVEQYTPLICHVASKYLTDPEDVKECVNDVFTEVYLHRAEFSPEKGSLASWIGTIARNRAISRYRKGRKDQPLPEDGAETERSGPDTTAELEQAMDVEQAISQLSETDQQIIRMKYYGGMSISEIAEALHIPYETVKKRHTRSIKQLRKLLLTILIIAALLILAACGVIQLLRHLGVLPGYGVTADPTGICYVLEEPVTYQEGLFTVEIARASMFDGRLAVHYRLDMNKTEYVLPERDENGEATWRRLSFANDLRDGAGAVLDCSSSSGYGSAPWDSSEFSVEGDRVCWLTGKSLSAFRSGQRQELTLYLSDIRCDGETYGDIAVPFALTPAEPEELDGYAVLYDEAAGGVMLDSRLEGDTLTLDLYPLSNGTTEWSAAPLREYYDVSMLAGSAPPLTIVDEEGNEFLGETQLNWQQQPDYCTYTFTGIAPGTYTLSLPYVYLVCYPEEGDGLVWDLEDCTFSDKPIQIPGGTMRTISVRQDDSLIDPLTNYSHAWEIRMLCEMEDERMTVTHTPSDDPLSLYPWVAVRELLEFFIGGGNAIQDRYACSYGELDAESGELVMRYYADDTALKNHNFGRVEYYPSDGQFDPICIRCEGPFELEFEVTP